MIVTDIKELHIISDPITPDEYESVFALLEANLPTNGLGLSAPQIGIKKRAFIYWGNENGVPVLHRVANPVIISYDLPKIMSKEGCLSLPNIQCLVERYSQIEVTDDIMGHYVLTDNDAIVYQHELNHLDGLLITDVGIIIPNHKIGRNEKCYCGSGKKFKKCHGEYDV